MAKVSKGEEVKETKKIERKTIPSSVLKVMEKIKEEFGDDVVCVGSDSKNLDIKTISTGSLGLDCVIGAGGLPQGRVIEIFGPESSGKTLISLSTIANCQRNGGQAVFIDMEQSLTKDWCRSLGVDFDRLIISQPNSGEEALKIVQRFIETNEVDIIVIDSVAALVPKQIIDGEIGDVTVAVQARMLSQALSKINPIISKTKVCAVFINQLRSNIGGYGNPETTPGGKALKFYASLRLRVSKESQSEIKDSKGNQIGHRMKVAVVKNKIGSPGGQASFELLYTKGIQQKSEISELSVIKGIVQNPKGRTYTFRNYTWTSRKEFDEAVKKDIVLADALMEEVKKAVAENAPDVVETTIEEVDGMIVDKATGEILEESAADQEKPVE
jgi:recombination protein RecA